MAENVAPECPPREYVTRSVDWINPLIQGAFMNPVQVVQEFTDSVNARDVDRVTRCFSAEAVMTDDPGSVFALGQESIREHFCRFLSQSPDFHADVLSRIEVGCWVVQHEYATGLVLEQPVPAFHIAVAYRIEDGKIVKTIGLQ